MDDINDEHAWLDIEFINNAQDADNHFDDCHFSGSATRINNNLKDARVDADPKAFNSGDLADQWGQVLHPIEDFYAHSSWVEMFMNAPATPLLDTGLGLWNALKPYSIHDGMMLVEGEDETPFGPSSSLTLSGWYIDVYTGNTPPQGVPANTYYPGVMSGSWGPDDNCPDKVTWHHDDLNKDTYAEGGDLYVDAYQLANHQVRHEWCRLLNISNAKYGIAGPAALLGLWVSANGIPHPEGTAGELETPGDIEVVASVNKIQVLNDQDPNASGELNFISLIFTGNFRQSARNEVAHSLSIEDPAVIPSVDFPASELPKPVRLCVKSTDTVAVSLQAWDDDDGPDGEFNNSYPGASDADDPLDGVTLSLTGPNFSPGTKIVSSDDLKVTFTITVNATDSDGDGLGDCLEKTIGTLINDPDSDDDGLNDGAEVNTYGTNPLSADSDKDGLGDSAEVNVYGANPLLADSDNDGLIDSTEINGANPTLPMDADSDKDGLLDGAEDANHNGARDAGETNPNNPDFDRDTLTDGCEVLGKNPTNPFEMDTDKDGLSDSVEDANHNCAIDEHDREPDETDPNDPDSDDDALTDGIEVKGSNPTVPMKADTDNDELNDGFEVANGTNPIDPDGDDNSILDGEDVGWIQQAVNAIPDTLFMPSGRKAILDQLDAIKSMVLAGQFNTAVNELMLLRTHVDGCGASADGDDWIIDCTEQIKLQTFIDLVIKNLTN